MINPPPWSFRPDLRRSEFAEDADLADILARALRSIGPSRRRTSSGWTIGDDEIWVIAGPTDRPRREQGWKLHLSATVHSARTVLSRALPILLTQRCHFKFARSLRQLEILNGIGCPEGLSGKFLTVYPANDAVAVELARQLDVATAGLDGPRILSDRPLRPGSLVHVRFGAFRARLAFTAYGLRQPVIARPDGALVEDRRLGRFTPPAWAGDPFHTAPAVTPGDGRPSERGDALQIGTYRIEAALKRANRGGAYRALDVSTGQEVVVKEARPHVATDRFGRDARDRLRHEHAILAHLAAPETAGLAPRPLDLFDRSGHLFLVREFLPGLTLRTVVRRRFAAAGVHPPDGELRAITGVLGRMLDRFQTTGLVVRDLNPNNLLHLGDDERGVPRFALVDLELAADPLDAVAPFRGATLAYASPQQEDDFAPSFADDVYSLGATLTYIATGSDPFFLADAPLGRSRLDKIEERLALHRAPVWAADLILRCLSPDPADRPTAAEIVATLAPPARAARTVRRLAAPPRPTSAQLLGAVDGTVEYLVAARSDAGSDRLWPATAFGTATDPLCVGHGAAGVGLFLLQCLRAGRSDAATGVIEDIVAVVDRLPMGDDRPIGLSYGQAGLAWFLAEAGQTLARPELTQRGATLLHSLPTAGEAPDLMVGTVGLLLTAVRLASLTGDPALLARVEAGAGALAASAVWTERGPVWPIPAHFAVDQVGKTYPGYAYGLAGIAYALLSAAHLTGRQESADLAGAALGGLLAWRQVRDGRRWWPTSSHATVGSPCWLKGASGIGAGLVRAARLTGDPVYRDAALDCWRMVRPAPRHGPLTQLNGLAGVGEFCLDLADLLGVEEAWDDAREIARTIYANRVDRRSDGFGVSFPDEDGLVGADLLTGVTGIASFLLRLANGHGTPRLLTLDDLLPRDTLPEDGS